MKKVTKATYLKWYEDMLFWRKFEDKLAQVYIQQKVRGFLHLYNGQEAVLAGCHHAINPEIDKFREFPNYLRKLDRNHTIAMFCTGGIRCEKASVFLEKKGFNNVFQLKGGILNYLKKIKKNKSLWKGECYVFDN